MAEKRFDYEVGTYRESRDGHRDEGRDGLLWLPEHRVLAVADGIGKEGEGQEVTHRFGLLMEMLKHFRASFLGLLGKGFHSTFAAIQLPSSTDAEADAIAVGDSSLRLFRDGDIRTLLERDHLWSKLLDIDMGYNTGMPLLLLENDIAMAYFDERQIEAYISKLRKFCSMLDYPIDDKVESSLEGSERDQLERGDNRKRLGLMLDRCRDAITLDLACSPKSVQDRVKEGKRFSLQDGDLLVAHTDGVDASDRQLEDVLSAGGTTARDLAKKLVRGRVKQDDAAAVVVRVQEASSAS